MASIENELKLIPSPTITIDQVLNTLSSEQGITVQKQRKVKQEDTYYDTLEGTLEKNGRSFRIRRKEGSIEVTYKEPIESDTEYKQRQEYQIVVSTGDAKTIDLKTAIRLLREKYPEISLPANMHEELTVVNDRNKTNLICPDGTVLEMAFDSLKGKKQNELYSILPEIEFEVLEGDPQNLAQIHNIITRAFRGRIRTNQLSKFARAKKEIGESEVTLAEVATCVLFSQILNSQEFDKLKQKGQILHKYDKTTETNLDGFKDFSYMLKTIKQIKRGDYTFAIPRVIAENEQMKEFLEGEKYEVKEEITLEDMFCLLLSNMPYKVLEEVLVHFLNTNYYGIDDSTTNRFSHSQQVMLTSGLLARSVVVGANFEERLTSMMSALFHDIGHVPTSHTLELVLREIDGIFSHEINGKKTIDGIYFETREDMMRLLRAEFPELAEEVLEKSLEKKATELKEGIANHSRKGATNRSNGINNQAARVNDKICYVSSDIADLIRYALLIEKRKLNILDDEWLDNTILEICGKETELFKTVKESLERMYIGYLRGGSDGKANYGRAIVNVVNSIESSFHGDREHYNVNGRLWSFIEMLIDRIKDVREEMTVEQAKKEMSLLTMDYIVESLEERCINNGENVEIAWENILREITRMGEMDLLDRISQKQQRLLLQRLNSLRTINQNGIATDNTIVTARIIEACAYVSFIARGTPEEQAYEMAKKIGEETKKYTPQQILSYFQKNGIQYVQPSRGNSAASVAEVIALIDQLHAMSDVQLKIQPGRNVSLKGICEEAKIKLGTEGGMPSHITDEYYQATFVDEYNVSQNIGIKVRTREGSQTKELIVKISIGKKVPERAKKKFMVECPLDYDVKAMLQTFREKHKGINVELVRDEPYEVIDTQRTTYQGMYAGFSFEIFQDTFSGQNGVLMQEFEFKCPECPDKVSKFRKALKEKYESAFITKSKSKRTMEGRGTIER